VAANKQTPGGIPRKVEFTQARLKRLREQYQTALAMRQESFEFEPGRQMFTAYAKILLEHFEGVPT
jgi:hypothetical protein